MAEQIFEVDGLHCGGCVKAVTAAFTELPEVTDVHVDLVPEGTSTVRVSAGRALAAAEIQAALAEEGDYTLRG